MSEHHVLKIVGMFAPKEVQHRQTELYNFLSIRVDNGELVDISVIQGLMRWWMRVVCLLEKPHTPDDTRDLKMAANRGYDRIRELVIQSNSAYSLVNSYLEMIRAYNPDCTAAKGIYVNGITDWLGYQSGVLMKFN
jgi:hypothetical protein